jgi:hypothetical protein
MRFSDMMGSGAERPPKSNEPSEGEPDVVADALAPYLDPAPRNEPAPVTEAIPLVASMTVAEATFPTRSTTPPEPAKTWVPDRPVPSPAPAPAPVLGADAVVSDDLLPRRRSR